MGCGTLKNFYLPKGRVIHLNFFEEGEKEREVADLKVRGVILQCMMNLEEFRVLPISYVALGTEKFKALPYI